MDIQAYFDRTWVPWSVALLSLIAYASVTLALRTKEPETLAKRLSLTHGQLSDAASRQEVLEYRMMRLVLEGVRVASGAVFAIGTAVLAQSYFGGLSTVALSIAGVFAIVVLIVVRVTLSSLPDDCYEDVEMWVGWLGWLAIRFGSALGPFRTSVTDSLYRRNGTEASKENASDILTVARNLSKNDVRAKDLMDPVANLVVLDADAKIGETYDDLKETGVESVVVSGDWINEVLGTVHRLVLWEALEEGKVGRDSPLESVMLPVVKLAETQGLGSLMHAFREREEEIGIVIGEDGSFLGTLTYNRVVRRLFANGGVKPEGDDASGVGTAVAVETQESVG